MPELKNPRHEKFARNLIKHNFNKTQAYLEAYPSSSYDNARSTGPQVLAKPCVKQRVKELLETSESLNLESITSSLSEDLKAQKPLIINNEIHYVRDNSNILKTKLKVLELHGALNEGSSVHGSLNTQNNLQINYYTPQKLEKLEQLTSKLEELNNRMLTDNEIQDGEIV